jgi:hypothetical protein
MKPTSLCLPPCLPCWNRPTRTYIRTSVTCTALRRVRQMTSEIRHGGEERLLVVLLLQAVVCVLLAAATAADSSIMPSSILRPVEAAGACKSCALSWQHCSGQRAGTANRSVQLCTCSLQTTLMAQAPLERMGRRGARATSG